VEPYVVTSFVYALKDPETRKIRYIGHTAFPKKRLSVHLSDRGRNHRTNWIKSLRVSGVIPEMEVLLVVPTSEAPAWEIKFIAEARRMGLSLVNGTDGGETNNCRGIPKTPEARAKMRAAKLGKKLPPFSREHCEKIGDANRGKRRTPEQCRVNSLVHKGKPWSEARRAAHNLNHV
jgi:hypothetical protein